MDAEYEQETIHQIKNFIITYRRNPTLDELKDLLIEKCGITWNMNDTITKMHFLSLIENVKKSLGAI